MCKQIIVGWSTNRENENGTRCIQPYKLLKHLWGKERIVDNRQHSERSEVTVFADSNTTKTHKFPSYIERNKGRIDGGKEGGMEKKIKSYIHSFAVTCTTPPEKPSAISCPMSCSMIIIE